MLITSCHSPVPISKLKANSTETIWNYGREYTVNESNNITTFVAFERSYDEFLIFNVEVVNNSETSVLISPEESYYIPVYNKHDNIMFDGVYDWEMYKDSIDHVVCWDYKLFSIDPEEKLLEIDMNISRGEAEQKNQATYNIIAASLDVAAGVAIAASDNTSDEDVDEWFDLAAERREERRIDEINLQNSIVSFKDNRNYWESRVLRKTTLIPNYSINGKVFFPRERCATDYIFYFSIGSDVLKIEYKHLLIYP